eukprot:TRINITY_DN6579_c0_g1_i4.p1 TRINITY_DN6579_c0_g1~~TRINITY_DN6579_c0_g1_i4.p1  ORF type:complete len:1317 (-),score=321.61 TRINITY_DN6579_c0_g1_i4:72-4022(-)
MFVLARACSVEALSDSLPAPTSEAGSASSAKRTRIASSATLSSQTLKRKAPFQECSLGDEDPQTLIGRPGAFVLEEAGVEDEWLKMSTVSLAHSSAVEAGPVDRDEAAAEEQAGAGASAAPRGGAGAERATAAGGQLEAAPAAWRPRGNGFVELSFADAAMQGGTCPSAPFLLPCATYERLHPYQRVGVAWLAGLYRLGRGGLLADDMGLGKTIQICALLRGLRPMGARYVLTLLPVTLLDQWTKEAATWCDEWPVHVYQGTATQRSMALRNVGRAEGGLLLVSYNLFSHSVGDLSEVSMTTPSGQASRRPWDLVLCDEGHKLKNLSTTLCQGVRTIKAKSRILLTGTPVQNSLQDLWSLMDFAEPGLLGNRATFLRRFAEPIAHGSVRNASPYAVGLKNYLSEQLWSIVSPHLLRRTKVSVGLLAGEAEGPTTSRSSGEAQASEIMDAHEARMSTSSSAPALPPKTEIIVWLQPTAEQLEMYRRALAQSDLVRQAASKAKLGVEVFQAIGLLKRICNHPSLAHSGADDCKPCPSGGQDADDAQGGAVTAELPEFSGKLRCLSALLPALAARGHRTLIFAQGVRMLDLIESCVLKRLELGFLRIDGGTDVATRAQRVRSFQEDHDRYSCLLLTTGVGGFGLNITSADRVVIADPAWNPAVDQQAIDRAHRLGQQKPVVVYRLIMSGLIEDKIFRLQVFKMGLTRTALESNNQQNRYFTAREVRGLFDGPPEAAEESETRRLLREQLGEEQDTVAHAAVDADGGSEWLPAGPALGLSLASRVFSLADQEDVGGASAENPVMAQLRCRIDAADRRLHETAEVRRESERLVDETTEAFERVGRECLAAAARKEKVATDLRDRRLELNRVARLEALALRELEKAEEARKTAEANFQAAELSKRNAEEEASASVRLASHLRDRLAVADGRVHGAALDGVRAALAVFDDAGRPADAAGCVQAPPTGLRVTRRALADVCRALVAAAEKQEARSCIEEELLTACMSSACASSSSSSPSATGLVPLEEDALRSAQASQAAATSEAERANGLVSSSIDALEKAGLPLVAAFRIVAGSSSTRGAAGASELALKRAREGISSAIAALRAAWTEAQEARQAWARAAALRLAPQRSLAAATLNLAEARARLSSAEQAMKKATVAAEARRGCRERLGEELRAAESARTAAEAAEVDQRLKREWLTSAVGSKYLSALRSRAAEAEAASGRASLYAECSKAEQLIVRMEQEKVAAVEALRGEEYVPSPALASGRPRRERDYDHVAPAPARASAARPPPPPPPPSVAEDDGGPLRKRPRRLGGAAPQRSRATLF